MKLVVLLHAVPGQEAALASYEDRVLQILQDAYAGTVLQRLTLVGDGPSELQVLELPDEGTLAAFMADPGRLAMTAQRDACVARTELFRAL